MAAPPGRRYGLQASCAGPAMPTRVEDYEVLYTIGTGSYGRCQKIRRKSDGKVSAGLVPACAPRPPRGSREPGGVLLTRKSAQKRQPLPLDLCLTRVSRGMGSRILFFVFFFNL